MAKQHNKVGPIIGTFVVVIVIIGAALYVFAGHINRQTKAPASVATTTTIIQSPATADDIQTLRNELNNALK